MQVSVIRSNNFAPIEVHIEGDIFDPTPELCEFDYTHTLNPAIYYSNQRFAIFKRLILTGLREELESLKGYKIDTGFLETLQCLLYHSILEISEDTYGYTGEELNQIEGTWLLEETSDL